jgi:hypothetical protein
MKMKNLLLLMFALAISVFVMSTSLMAADQVVTSNADAGAGTPLSPLISVPEVKPLLQLPNFPFLEKTLLSMGIILPEAERILLFKQMQVPGRRPTVFFMFKLAVQI